MIEKVLFQVESSDEFILSVEEAPGYPVTIRVITNKRIVELEEEEEEE